MKTVDHAARWRACWQILKDEQEKVGLNLEVEKSPLGLVKYALYEFNLNSNTAQILAYKFLGFLDEKNVIEIVHKPNPSGRGKSCMGKFRLLKLECPDFSGLEKSQTRKVNPKMANSGLEVSEVERRLIKMEQMLKANLEKSNTLPAQENKEKTVAVWIDSPNFFNNSRNLGYEPPIAPLMKKIFDLGETMENTSIKIVHTAVFVNMGCPEDILRLYKCETDCILVICIYNKRLERCSSVEQLVSDPVDEEMEKNIRKWYDIADVHVIASEDKDFMPLRSWLKQQGKTTYWIEFDRREKEILFRGDHLCAPLTNLIHRNSGYSNGNGYSSYTNPGGRLARSV